MPVSRTEALLLAADGYRVFRTDSNTLKPRRKGWPETASCDRDVVEKDFTGADGDSVSDNIGILTGDSLFVVDVDVKDDKPGLESLKTLIADGLPEETFTVRTPSGGLHLYYDVDPTLQLAGGVNWRPGVDTRARHNYVNAPGSVRGETAYEVVKNVPRAKLPEKFIAEIKRGRPPAEPTKVDSRYQDTWAIDRAVEYIKTAEPESGPGHRHKPLVLISRQLFDYGITPDLATELIAEHWREADAFGPDDLAYQVRTIAETHEREGKFWGAVHPRMAFPQPVQLLNPDHEAPASEKRAKAAKFYSLEDCLTESLAAKDEPLVADLLDKGALSEWYGGSNTGKTFILLSVGLAIAAGEPWAGKPTAKGLVVYFALEGGMGILKRGAALAKMRADGGANLPFFLAPAPIDLRNGSAGLKQLLADVKAIETLAGERAAFIVVDTLSRALAGGDENASVDMGKLVQAFTAIQEATGAHVAIVHHTGKNETAGARGHSLMKGAVDTEIFIKREPKAKIGVIETTKQRDREIGGDFNFTIEDRPIGVNVDGDSLKSAVAIVTPARVTIEKGPALTEGEQAALDALKGIEAGAPGGRGATASEWLKAAQAQAQAAGQDPWHRQTFARTRTALRAKKIIEEHVAGLWRLKDGQESAFSVTNHPKSSHT